MSLCNTGDKIVFIHKPTAAYSNEQKKVKNYQKLSRVRLPIIARGSAHFFIDVIVKVSFFCSKVSLITVEQYTSVSVMLSTIHTTDEFDL